MANGVVLVLVTHLVSLVNEETHGHDVGGTHKHYTHQHSVARTAELRRSPLRFE